MGLIIPGISLSLNSKQGDLNEINWYSSDHLIRNHQPCDPNVQTLTFFHVSLRPCLDGEGDPGLVG